jgi:hypothetical protein
MKISGSTSGFPSRGAALIFQGVNLMHNAFQVSNCAVLVIVKLVNGNTGAANVSVETDSDLFIDESPVVDVYDINDGGGLRIEQVTHTRVH